MEQEKYTFDGRKIKVLCKITEGAVVQNISEYNGVETLGEPYFVKVFYDKTPPMAKYNEELKTLKEYCEKVNNKAYELNEEIEKKQEEIKKITKQKEKLLKDKPNELIIIDKLIEGKIKYIVLLQSYEIIPIEKYNDEFKLSISLNVYSHLPCYYSFRGVKFTETYEEAEKYIISEIEDDVEDYIENERDFDDLSDDLLAAIQMHKDKLEEFIHKNESFMDFLRKNIQKQKEKYLDKIKDLEKIQ